MAHQVMQGGHSATVYTPMGHVGGGFHGSHTGGLSGGGEANSGGGWQAELQSTALLERKFQRHFVKEHIRERHDKYEFECGFKASLRTDSTEMQEGTRKELVCVSYEFGYFHCFRLPCSNVKSLRRAVISL